AETPLNIWFPSVNNILKKKFDCYPEDHSEPSWAIRAPYNPERQSICSTISSVQSYETTESANKVILALDLDISEEEQVIETEFCSKSVSNILEEDLIISESVEGSSSETEDKDEGTGLWQIKRSTETKLSIAKISETKYSKPKFS
uniref:Uncharacterized protein n=1 Tax=Megaselia scalaris TaxID=36166 RepID=T1GNI5_MEGSC